LARTTNTQRRVERYFAQDDDPSALCLPGAPNHRECFLPDFCIPLTFSQISMHFIISLSNENYSQAMSIARLKERLSGKVNVPPHNVPISDDYYVPKNTSRTGRRANAAIVMLGKYPLLLHLSQH
jgi:hypothetical protein